MMAGEGKRAELLDRTVKNYHAAIYWGDAKRASAFVSKDVRNSFVRDVTARSSSERLVEVKIEGIHLEEEAKKATVNCRVKFFRVPQNVVNTRLEKENWVFDVHEGGWINKGIEEVESFEHFEDIVSDETNSLTDKDFRARLAE